MKRILPCLFLLCILGTSTAAAQESRVAMLLDQLEMPYVKVQDGVYKVVVNLNNASTTLIAYESAAFGKKEDPKFQMISMFTIALDVPEGFRPPAAMLKQIAEINDNILVGKVSLGSNGKVYFNAGFFSRNADDTTMALHLLIMHQMRQELNELLSPYLEEE